MKRFGKAVIGLCSVILLSSCYGVVLDMNSATRSSDNPISTLSPIPHVNPDIVVIGQPDFRSNALNNTNRPSGSSFYGPRAVLKFGSKWIVVDTFNNRVLIYDGGLAGIPVVLGQPSAISPAASNAGLPAPTASTLYYPRAVASDGTKLIVSDGSNNRVLIWNSIPTADFAPADVVLGQANFVSNSANQSLAGATAATLSGPTGLAIINGNLLIADSNNHRVLIYSSIPTSNGASANLVIGQNALTNNSGNAGNVLPTQNSLYSPTFLSTDGTRLVVADYRNNRVLIWNTVPAANGANADVVFGQADFTHNLCNGTALVNGACPSPIPNATPSGFAYPYHAVFGNGGLYAADYYNSRILFWNFVPTSGAAGPASGVIGQAGFNSRAANRGQSAPSANTFSYPLGLMVDGTDLWICDNNRLIKYSPLPTGSTDSASDVFGQDNMTAAFPNKIGPNKHGFNSPIDIAVHGNWLLVLDKGNSSVLVFDKENHQDGAVALIGQPNFESASPNQGGTTGPNTLDFAINYDGGVATDPFGRVYISDTNNNRILVFNQIPTSNNASADYVIGQPDFTSKAVNNALDGAKGLNAPRGITAKDNKLLVADGANNRVLIFDLPVITNQPAASMVLGQPDFNTFSGGTTALKMNYPITAEFIQNRIFVADVLNRRMLIWSSLPTVLGTNADAVIGQPDFTSNDPAGPNAKRLTSPAEYLTVAKIALVDDVVFIPSKRTARILGFTLSELAAHSVDPTASYVIGQAGFTTALSSPIANSSNTSFGVLPGPTAIIADPDGRYVWIDDYYASRILRIQKSAFWSYVNH